MYVVFRAAYIAEDFARGTGYGSFDRDVIKSRRKCNDRTLGQVELVFFPTVEVCESGLAFGPCERGDRVRWRRRVEG